LNIKVHTNTAEGLFGNFKNGVKSQFHLITKKYTPFYLSEFEYKYNRRFEQKSGFGETLLRIVTLPRSVVRYQPIKDQKINVFNL
jgi:hypothetical protein